MPTAGMCGGAQEVSRDAPILLATRFRRLEQTGRGVSRCAATAVRVGQGPIMSPQEKRWGTSPQGKMFLLTDEMIALRDRLAEGLGYVLRKPCSMSGNPGDFECWETKALTYCLKGKGKMISPLHCVRTSESGRSGLHCLWPEDVTRAAWAIDKGKPRKETA